jgi:hypothetical protein
VNPRDIRTAAWLLGASVVAGCASTQTQQAKEASPSGFMGEDAKLLEKGRPGQTLLRYEAPDVPWSSYRSILLEPVQYWEPRGKKDELPAQDKKRLTDFAYSKLQENLKTRWTLVREPGPDTLRLRFALVDARGSDAVLDTTSSVLPVGAAVSTVKQETSGKPTGVGDAQAEMKASDAQSGKLLLAAVDRRVGAKSFERGFKEWDDVESAISYWAQRTAFRLCVLQGAADCAAPSEGATK